MIFRLKFSDKTEYAQAKSQLHLLQNYSQIFDDFLEIQEVEEISDESAKTIMLSNNEYNPDEPETDENFKEFSLWDTVCGDGFVVVGSTEWD